MLFSQCFFVIFSNFFMKIVLFNKQNRFDVLHVSEENPSKPLIFVQKY